MRRFPLPQGGRLFNVSSPKGRIYLKAAIVPPFDLPKNRLSIFSGDKKRDRILNIGVECRQQIHQQ
jgi:hypothetical protein